MDDDWLNTVYPTDFTPEVLAKYDSISTEQVKKDFQETSIEIDKMTWMINLGLQYSDGTEYDEKMKHHKLVNEKRKEFIAFLEGLLYAREKRDMINENGR